MRSTTQHALIALGVFLGVVTLSNGPFKASILEWQDRGRETIAIEHAGPAALTMDMSERSGSAIVEYSNEGEDDLLISMPETWHRREVRNASLDDVVAASTGLGYARWTLPPGATLSLAVADVPAHLTLEHPSSAPLKIRFTRVDLDTDTVTRDVILVQGETTEVW